MAGLITANKLVHMLVKEIFAENQHLSAYFIIVKNKVEYSDLLKKKNLVL